MCPSAKHIPEATPWLCHTSDLDKRGQKQPRARGRTCDLFRNFLQSYTWCLGGPRVEVPSRCPQFLWCWHKPAQGSCPAQQEQRLWGQQDKGVSEARLCWKCILASLTEPKRQCRYKCAVGKDQSPYLFCSSYQMSSGKPRKNWYLLILNLGQKCDATSAVKHPSQLFWAVICTSYRSKNKDKNGTFKCDLGPWKAPRWHPQNLDKRAATNSEPNSDKVTLPEAMWKSGEVVPVSHLSDLCQYPLRLCSEEPEHRTHVLCYYDGNKESFMKDKCDIPDIHYQKKKRDIIQYSMSGYIYKCTTKHENLREEKEDNTEFTKCYWLIVYLQKHVAKIRKNNYLKRKYIGYTPWHTEIMGFPIQLYIGFLFSFGEGSCSCFKNIFPVEKAEETHTHTHTQTYRHTHK